MNKLNKQTPEPQLRQTAVGGSAFLSGKCEEHFIIFYTGNKKYKNDLKQYKNNLQASIIISWFDSIEFYINIEVIKDKMLGYVRGFDSDVTLHFQGDLITINSDCLKDDIYNTRDEAVLKAIQKASEVYNTKFSQADG